MWIGLLLAALAAAGSSYQQHKVAQKQDQMLYQALKGQEDTENQARAKLNQSLQAYDPSKAKAATDTEKSDYLGQVQKAIGANPIGGANSTTTQAQLLSQQRANDTAQKNDALAGLYGTIGGATTQRQNEGIATQRTGNELGLLGDMANRTYAADVNRARSIQANPWLAGLWQVMGAMGSAYGAGAGGGMSGASSTGGFNGATGAGTYSGYGSTSTSWPGMSGGWGR